MATPDQWRDTLDAQLTYRWNRLRVFDAYYNGDQPLAFITRKYRDAYGGFFKGLTDNWMPIVVDSSAERLRVQGFRFTDTGPGGENDLAQGENADKDAWNIWQANNLDGEANKVHTESIKLSMAYWMVTPNGDTPLITAEHPEQVIVACDPADRRQRLAAYKRWYDWAEDVFYANVYLPDRVVKYAATPRSMRAENDPSQRWETIGATSNTLGEVPVIPVPNNPGMLSEGKSDLEGGPIEVQNAINLLLSSMLIGAEYQAYPLRVLLGVDTPRDPATGEPIKNAEAKLSQSRLLTFPGNASDMDVKEFSAADLSNLRNAIDGLVRDLTAQTRTPPHYVAGQIVNASGDALKAAETGLVSKVRDKQDPFGEAHEQMIRLAFKSIDANDPRASSTSCETVWRDPEVRSDSERVAAAVQMQTLGVPQEALWEKIGASPQEIDRWQAMKEQEALVRAAQAPPPQVPTPLPPGGNGQVPPEVAQAAADRAAAGPAAPPASPAAGSR